MKRSLYLATALMIGALIAQYLLTDPGYVAVRVAGRLVETSFIALALSLLALWFLVRWLVRVANRGSVRHKWRVEVKQDRARRSLSRAVLELSEGNWERAEATLVRSARDADTPATHYLIAARAADLLGASARRDQHLARALDASNDRRAPALIMQAELHLKHKQLQQAQTTLEQLDASGEQNARGLLLLARVFRQTGNWQGLEALEPRLRHTRGISTRIADETVTQIYMDRLKAAGAAADATLLEAAWQQMPKSLAQHSQLVQVYARAAMQCGDFAAAETQLRALLSREWNEAAVLAYGDLEGDDALGTLDCAEQWLAKHAQDPALLMTCARLAMRAELYGKARSYLETSIAIRPRLEAYQMLAGLMEQLGERDRAIEALNDALVYALGRKPNLPKIRVRRFSNRRHSERRQI
jgi:HemY protein